jgi:UDP-N-acetylmuramoylalanine--D-glutamate ligase
MNLQSKRVVVMGLGRFGGGVGVARYLVRQGADLCVTDLDPPDRLRESLAQLQGLPIQFRLGEHRDEDFTHADLIVVNPAVDPRNNPYLLAAARASVPLTTEIRLLVAALPNRNRTIGVTGTAGKSTVTAMIGHILQQSPTATAAVRPSRVYVGGNIGGSLLDQLPHIHPDDWVVLELSSFMLEALAQDRWSPHIAVITNLADNHLDRHGTMHAYTAAKQTILDDQTPSDHAIFGPELSNLFHPRVIHPRWLHAPPNPPISLKIPGRHNQINAALAIHAAAAAGIDPAAATPSLQQFTGLPHRLQLVHEAAGIRYFNDSKATTPQAAQLAISSFEPDIVHAILGGYDKKSDLTPLAEFAAGRCRAVYTIGATGPTLADAVQHAGGRACRCETLDRAVHLARQQAQHGHVVLLSPGCASWDQFENYEKRGDAFTLAASTEMPAAEPSTLP